MQPFDVAVEPQITTNDLHLMVRDPRFAGGGITFALEETFRPYIVRGEFDYGVRRLSAAFPGFFLYFPNRRNMAPSCARSLTTFAHTDRRRPSCQWLELTGYCASRWTP